MAGQERGAAPAADAPPAPLGAMFMLSSAAAVAQRDESRTRAVELLCVPYHSSVSSHSLP